jgi:regulator of protease activity HflC (stomatin/prohibitin superfamily)
VRAHAAISSEVFALDLLAFSNCFQVIASEGERAAAVNRSEAQRCQFINNSEGERQATVNAAEGRAQQIVLEAQGRAQVVNMAAAAQKSALEMFVSAGLSPAEASRLSVALRYVDMLPSVLAVPSTLFSNHPSILTLLPS